MPTSVDAPRGRDVLALGVAQTLAWGSTYYLPAVLAAPMAASLGVAPAWVHAAFSLALVVSALAGPVAGAAIDRHGGRPVLAVTSVLFALGLALLSTVQDRAGLFAAWALIGLGMGSGLYEAAFATLVRRHGAAARGAINGVTLLGGLASTVGWPLSALAEAQVGWRGACLAWAAAHLLIGLPLNLLQPSTPKPPLAPPPASAQAGGAVTAAPAPRGAAAVLAFVFAVGWFVSTAMAAHLPALLQAAGASLAVAVAAGALVGPAQVVARLAEFGLLRRWHPLLSARLAALGHPAGALALLLAGAPAAVPFALLHGAGNGILTIAKGTLPLVIFGAAGYGARQGWLMVPARLAQAAAPLLFGLALARWGTQALALSAGLSLAACASLLWLRVPRDDSAVPQNRTS